MPVTEDREFRAQLGKKIELLSAKEVPRQIVRPMLLIWESLSEHPAGHASGPPGKPVQMKSRRRKRDNKS